MLTNLWTRLIANISLRKYVANASWLILEKLIRMFVGVFVSVWVARYLGPEDFGLLNYSHSIVVLLGALATLGLDGIIVRELVKNEKLTDRLLSTGLTLKLAGSCLTFCVLFLLTWVMGAVSHAKWLIFIIAGTTVFQSVNVIDFYFQAKVLSKYTAWSNSAALFLSSAVKILLIIIEAPLEWFAATFIFEAAILSIGLLYFFLKNRGLIKFQWDKNLAFSLLADSWPLILSSIVVSIYMRIDQLMLQSILGPDAVGQYSAALKLSEVWYFFPVAIVSTLFPAIVASKGLGDIVYFGRLRKLYSLLVWTAIAIALPVSFFSSYIIDLLYGESYKDASSVLQIHIWGAVFVFLGVAFSSYLTAENMTIRAFSRTAAGAFVNILLNWFLIPLYGVQGAAVATLISQITANLLYDIFDGKLRPQLYVKLSAFIPFLKIK